MSNFLVSTCSSPLALDENNSTKQDHVIRNTVTFHSSIWGDQFLTYDEKDDLVAEKQLAEELIEETRKELIITTSSHEPIQHMKLIQLIDAVQRLGVAYHFEKEIEDALQHVYRTYGHQGIHNNNDLQSISLWFRILRQQGFNVSSEIFKNHMDEKGNLFSNDVQSMLALYEASYMRVEGEKVLDDALEFTKTHLAIIAKDPSCDSSLRTQIQDALRQPLRKRLPRLEAVRYIPIYQQQSSHNQILLKLAKLDFNMLQTMHKKELSEICKWWKDLDMQNKLPFVRDRLIEGYFWILGIYFEPHHSRSRMFLIKSCMWLVGYMPTLDEYISNSLITCAYAVMIARSYVGGDDKLVNEDSFKWVATHPPLVKASCLILRLMDDIATHKEEQERGHVASSIECYIKETGATEEEAREHFSKQVEDAWKVVNRESLRPTAVAFPLVMPAINLARMCDALYKGNHDGYNHAGKEVIQYIKSLLVHPLI
ncbi:Terpene synthase, metal-binding domain-containing protein [Cynara cardunculus var. scolymus]|uniref:Terpene synthase, metal-binding domain-containing protein n=1 Tax=Cynara cardunculus var. scolymus TaxID=59895 RepID=A0A103XRG2_CYNCS|nr:Terpene synthase, metal-binding domain-containing protein [Cynara cardunculus var. scolymus]